MLGDNFAGMANAQFQNALPPSPDQQQRMNIAQQEMAYRNLQAMMQQKMEREHFQAQVQQHIQDRQFEAVGAIGKMDTPGGARLAFEAYKPYMTPAQQAATELGLNQFQTSYEQKLQQGQKAQRSNNILEWGPRWGDITESQPTTPATQVNAPWSVFEGPAMPPPQTSVSVNAPSPTMPGVMPGRPDTSYMHLPMPGGDVWVRPKTAEGTSATGEQADFLKAYINIHGGVDTPEARTAAYSAWMEHKTSGTSLGASLMPMEIKRYMQGGYKTGAEFVAAASQNPATAAVLDQITHYEIRPGGGFQPTVGPAYMTAAKAWDPTFEPSRFEAIQKNKNDLMSATSVTGKNIQSLNTVMSHLNTLNDQFKTLQEHGKLTEEPFMSAFRSWYGQYVAGDADVVNSFGTILPVVTELDKALSNTAVEERIKQYQGVLGKRVFSADQAFGLVQDWAGLVQKRLLNSQQMYEKRIPFHKPGDLEDVFWTPEGRASYDSVMAGKSLSSEQEQLASQAEKILQQRPGAP